MTEPRAEKAQVQTYHENRYLPYRQCPRNPDTWDGIAFSITSTQPFVSLEAPGLTEDEIDWHWCDPPTCPPGSSSDRGES